MDSNLHFLNLEDLDDIEVKNLHELLHPSNYSSAVEFPWICCADDSLIIQKGCALPLNVHAPAFESYLPVYTSHVSQRSNLQDLPVTSYTNGSSVQEPSPVANNVRYYPSTAVQHKTLQTASQGLCNGQQKPPSEYDQSVKYTTPPNTVYDNDFYPRATPPASAISTFKLNPTVSSFVPQNIECYSQPVQPQTELQSKTRDEIQVSEDVPEARKDPEPVASVPEDEAPKPVLQKESKPPKVESDEDSVNSSAKGKTECVSDAVEAPSKPRLRSWADVVSRGQKPTTEKVSLNNKSANENENVVRTIQNELEDESLSLAEDKMALTLGRHLHDLKLNFKPVLLQSRGLINRRNWCYINASLQTLLACAPFYTLVRDLPLGPTMDRGKSSTPILDSMVKITYEFSQYDNPQEELQPGTPFQPDVIYDMLRDLKSDCLKGQQEDAEEFLSFILNGMHEEMVKVIKHYEKKNGLNHVEEVKENGDISDGEEEWQVIGSKHKRMVTRKVVEHKTPVSDLLGGQIKSFLTTSGNKTSASIQPFFTLQLDIQSDNVNSVSEALKEMTVKEPIQGYTCAKTKQEVEAFSHIAIQKLPPILILHLKRFVYNINGGCKKVMKKTDYPLSLEIGRDLFSSDVKKSQRLRQYKLFAVMYHDGEEAIKGHYISDVYSHGCQSWIRCDDRTVSTVTEDQVLSHSPPRVPYLLFYQES